MKPLDQGPGKETPAASPEAAASPKHHPGLDTLRALAIVMVIPFHAWQIWGGAFTGPAAKSVVKHGWAGVELFFVLSGFLIGSQLLQAVKREGRVPFGSFYVKRALRILPSYYVVLLLYMFWPAFREKPGLDAPWKFALFVMNYGRQFESLSHAWSLCVEEHFYLVFPALVAIFASRPKFLRPAVALVVLLVAAALWRFHLWSRQEPFFPSVYRPSHTHFDGLIVGVALALLKEHRQNAWTRLTSRPWLSLTAGIALVGFGLGMYQDLGQAASYALAFTVIAVGFGACLLAAMSPGFWLARWRIPGAATLASLAFTLYLTHKSMIHMAQEIVGDHVARRELTLALGFVLVALASLLLHFAVEKPFLRVRDRILRRS